MAYILVNFYVMSEKRKPLKILFVIETYFTNNNGTSISAQRFATELRKRGHEVRILTVGESGAPEIFGLEEYKLPVFGNLVEKHGFKFASHDKKVIEEAVAYADVIHCFMPFALEYHAKKEADRQHKPATAAFHIQPENLTSSINMGKVKWLNELFYKFFNRWIYKRFTHIHTPSRFMANEIIKRGYKAKVHPISNGISPDFKYRKLPKSPEFKDKILIIMVGRLACEKRQDVIINAVPYSKYADKIQLIFAGKGPEYERYQKLGKKLKNPPIFGYYNKEELMDVLAQCDLYVHASDMESEAISCIEAFATGLVPVISDSKTSATSQFALDGRSLFKAGDPKDLARAIDYWLDHPSEKDYMEKIYAKSAKTYSIDNSIRMFEDMLYEAIDEYEKGTAKKS